MKLDFYLWQKVMMELQDGHNINKISMDIEMTYSHASHLIKLLKDNGLITTEKTGRQVMLNLTIRGKKVQNQLRKLKHFIDSTEVSVQDPYKEEPVEEVAPVEVPSE